jgi:hypothetical protein
MHRWRITIEPHPFSSGKGAEADRKAAGADEGSHHFYVDAGDIREAMKMAQCFAEGMKRNPAVWEAPIIGVCVVSAAPGAA